MKTRNQKKRAGAGKDKRCPKKSNQQHSADPGDDAVEVGEMVDVTMDVHGGASGSLNNSYQTSDHRYLAWLLREKLNDIVDGGNGELRIPEPGLRSLLDMAASGNVVSVDPETFNPILWRTLPKELLHLVLARLPLPDITRLKCLSRQWGREFATANSDINRACDEGSTMVALLSHSCTDAFFVTIYDITKSRWQSAYHLHLRRPTPWDNKLEQCPHTWTPVDECHGGLVCFISLWKITKSDRLRIAVVNLLTRVQHELPPLHYQYKRLPTMVQIKVDSHTKHYKVVVAITHRGRDLTIESYDSKERKWTLIVPSSGSIIGSVHTWARANGWFYKLSSSTPRAYDFGEQKLQLHTDSRASNKRDWRLIDMALEKDRMFYLQEKRKSPRDTSLPAGRRRLHRSFHVEEYCLDNRTKDWVKGKSYECPAFEDRDAEELSAVFLNACDGFLMVIFHYPQRSTRFRLLDVTTGEWRNVPESPNSVGMHTTQSVLCRAIWNAIP